MSEVEDGMLEWLVDLLMMSVAFGCCFSGWWRKAEICGLAVE